MQLFTSRNIPQGLDENSALLLIGLAVAVTRMVDPARGIAPHPAVNHPGLVNVKIKRVIWVLRVMGVARLRLCPGDDLTHILDDGVTFGNVLHGIHTLAMNAGSADLNAPR